MLHSYEHWIWYWMLRFAEKSCWNPSLRQTVGACGAWNLLDVISHIRLVAALEDSLENIVHVTFRSFSRWTTPTRWSHCEVSSHLKEDPYRANGYIISQHRKFSLLKAEKYSLLFLSFISSSKYIARRYCLFQRSFLCKLMDVRDQWVDLWHLAYL